jgi:hypothetical protein
MVFNLCIQKYFAACLALVSRKRGTSLTERLAPVDLPIEVCQRAIITIMFLAIEQLLITAHH